MVAKLTFVEYEYPLKAADGSTYYGHYTIKRGVAPLRFKGEKKVATFEAVVRI